MIKRLRPHGGGPKTPAVDRLMEQIEPEPMSGCWLWMGARNAGGYGLFSDDNGRQRSAHRVSFELLRSPVPDGLQLDHLCRTPACVNPFHLEPVTPKENMARGSAATATHCRRGHPYSGNTIICRNGRRRCRVCTNLAQINTHHRRRARERITRLSDPGRVLCPVHGACLGCAAVIPAGNALPR